MNKKIVYGLVGLLGVFGVLVLLLQDQISHDRMAENSPVAITDLYTTIVQQQADSNQQTQTSETMLIPVERATKPATTDSIRVLADVLTPNDINQMTRASDFLIQSVIQNPTSILEEEFGTEVVFDDVLVSLYTPDDEQGIILLTVLDFASSEAAVDHFDTITSSDPSIEEDRNPVGDRSLMLSVNESGVHSAVLFLVDDVFVQLSTAGDTALISDFELYNLAEVIIDRLGQLKK